MLGIQIERYRSVDINLAGSNRFKAIMLDEIVLILLFYTSIVSFYQFIAKNSYQNTKLKSIIYQGLLFCYI